MRVPWLAVLALVAAGVAGVVRRWGAALVAGLMALGVLGGLFLGGGRGSVFGIVLGAVLIYLVEDVLLLTGAPSFYLEAFVGAVIVAAVVTNTWVAKRSI